MCGIAGFFQPSGFDGDQSQTLRAMTDRIYRRGPDDEGQWLDPEGGVAFGQRRLSIIDLSQAGHQPMVSHDGRYVLVVNGEIYNFQELRKQLAEEGLAPEWRGSSDTEVLLAALAGWGVETALQRATGMFALAFWDRKDRSLVLARDRMGEKPLYYGWQGSGSRKVLLFGSDLAAFEAHPSFKGEIDRSALNLLMRHNYIPAPRSIYHAICKLMPGTWARFGANSETAVMQPYWDMLKIAGEGGQSGTPAPDEAIDELERKLTAAVERQMVSDVPLGAFLSGGIDSSTIVALMQKISTRKVKTFTIGFGEEGFNEADHARAVAAHLGTDHSELYVAPRDAQAVIPDLASYYSEPFADSSQVPTFLVSKLARTDVTVALSGDGGDELFGGYNRYLFTQRYWRGIQRIPKPLRSLAANTIRSVPPDRWDRIGKWLGQPVEKAIGHKLHKGAELLGKASIKDLYTGLVSHFGNPAQFVVGSVNPDTYEDRNLEAVAGLPAIEWMMAVDSVHYLPDDILAKVDRAAMAVSLEARVPMLDPDVVRFAWSLPLTMKIRDGQTKWPLRQVLYRHVPQSLIERPKMGFGVPIAAWLRGPLRDWAESLLDPARMESEGYLSPKSVQTLWRDHLSGRFNHGYRLWTILMFQAWLRRSD